MTPSLIVEFAKWSGAGNDFIALDNRFYALSGDEAARLAAQLCDRRTGIGADGLLLLSVDGDPFDVQAADPRMVIYNADGSRATMCGNGARCMARIAAESGFGTIDDAATKLTLQTDAGPVQARVDGAHVTLDLPDARDLRAVHIGEHEVFYAWTGTEHAVVWTDDVDAVDVDALGRRLRHADVWGDRGANVTFAEVVQPGRIRVRTFEKGVEAETLACGTGAAAVGLAAASVGAVHVEGGRSNVEVQPRGGTLSVGFDWTGGAVLPASVSGVTLGGPAQRLFRGTFALGKAGFVVE
mgnify:CR=1 FL=1